MLTRPGMQGKSMMFELKDVTRRFGKKLAVDTVTLTMQNGRETKVKLSRPRG